MNAVSEASQALNQITALKEQAQYQFQQKKEQLGQEIEIPSEITLTAAGSYLGKKVLGYIGEKFSSNISEAASKVGISEETVGKALSGDISGAIESGTQELTSAAENIGSQISSTAENLFSQAAETATGVISKVAGNLENIPQVSLSSVMPETDIGNIYSQGLEDLRFQAGIDENAFREYTNVSIENARPFSFNNPSAAGQEVEMTDFANVGTPSTTGAAEAAGTEGTEAVSEAATTGADVAGEAGAAAAETVAEVGGAEAAGAALDATGVLAPLGALVGLIGGIVGFFEGHHQESESLSEAPTPVLNPSAQYL